MTLRKIVFAATLLAALLFAAVGFAAEGDEGGLPRTTDGRPDLSGVWDFRTLTPLQRPGNQSDKATLTQEEAAEVEARAVARTEQSDQPSDGDREAPPEGANVGAYNQFWFDHGAQVSEDRRTSLIVDPPNGRIPPTHPGAKEQVLGDDLPNDFPVRLLVGGIGIDGPESRGLSERCIVGFNAGPPITPGGYNQNVQIIQTPDHVVILNEMVHDARIVPTDGRGRLPMDIRRWMGASLGHWEGDTLVVETTNFTDKKPSYSGSFFSAVGTADRMHLTERFQRIGENTLRYEFTVDDPATYIRPFTGVLLMKRSDQRVYEYACHEGNYAIPNMLAGARMLEKLAAEGENPAED